MVDNVDFDDQEAKSFFEETFTQASGACFGVYAYSSATGRLRKLSTSSTEVQATLQYANKATAAKNINGMKEPLFQTLLISLLKENVAFKDFSISPVQLLSISSGELIANGSPTTTEEEGASH